MKAIVHTDPLTGNAAITICRDGLDPHAHAAQILPDGMAYQVLDDVAQLPGYPQRDYRNSWRLVAGQVIEDMSAAREIYREQVRAQRASLLAQLDTDYMRADERADTAEKARITAEKQRLRDAPADARIDAATTVDQLRALDVL